MMYLQLARIVQRLRGRKTFDAGHGTRLLRGARIVNLGDRRSRIRLGHSCRIAGEVFVFPHGGSVEIGDWGFVGAGTRIWSSAGIHIGHRVMISHNCNIFDSRTHPLDAAERHRHYRQILATGHPRVADLGESPVRIEDDVWIGAAATILRGVTIGARSIISAGSVVVSDVPCDSIAAGNPARVIRSQSTSRLDRLA
jgi:acetyltransferase-like isoleucine patch superfamily enzyme